MLRYSGDRGFEPIVLLLQQIMAELWPCPEQTNAPDPDRPPLLRGRLALKLLGQYAMATHRAG